MNFLMYACFVLMLVASGCKSENALREELGMPKKEETMIDSSAEKPGDSDLSKNPIYQKVAEKNNPKIDFLYEKYTDATWYYPLKFNDTTFSSENYIELLSAAKNSGPEKYMDKHCATFALQFSLYKGLDQKLPTVFDFKPVAYSEIVLNELFKESPSLIQLLPESHPQYQTWVRSSLQHHSDAFDYLPLRIKLSPETLLTLVDVPDDVGLTQQKAMAYASVTAAQQLVEKNGLLLAYALPEYQDNKYVVLAAIKNNPDAIAYASDPLKTAIKTNGIASLVTLQSTRSYGPVFLSVVKDLPLISRIEKKTGLVVTELWYLAPIGNKGKIMLCLFKPTQQYEAGIVVLTDQDDLLVHRKTASFDKMPHVWDMNDNGKFDPSKFKVSRVISAVSPIQIELSQLYNNALKTSVLTQTSDGRLE